MWRYSFYLLYFAQIVIILLSLPFNRGKLLWDRARHDSFQIKWSLRTKLLLLGIMRWHLVLSRITVEKYKEVFPGLYTRMPCVSFCLLWGGFCFFWTHRTTSAFGLSIPFSLLCYHYPHCWFITTTVDTIDFSFFFCEFLSSYSSFCSLFWITFIN